MGQYWMPVNLDKKEYVDPHKLGAGLKLWEQLANHPGTGAALIVLCAAMPERRGGGDFDLENNWHGPERIFPEHNTIPGPMSESYPEIAARTIGRWAGDRIALIGDYAQDGDIEPRAFIGIGGQPEIREIHAGSIYESLDECYTDITDEVCAVIEHELCGTFVGDGWRDFERG